MHAYGARLLREIARRAARAVTLAAFAAALAAPLQGQPAADVGQWLDALSSPQWSVRDGAVEWLSYHAERIPTARRGEVIELLRRELYAELAGPSESETDEEGYPEYLMRLTRIVERFNDARATPLLARQGIAISNGSVFQVASAGDAGIGPLVATWEENTAIRPAVVRTMAQMRYYADSTGRALAPSTAATIDAYLLRAFAAPEPWVRHAFVDAAEATRDPAYLPLVQRLASDDPAHIDGMRYIARDAGALIPALEARRSASSRESLVASLQRQLDASCAIAWITSDGICVSLRAKLDAAAAAIASDRPSAVQQLRALMNELDAQRGTFVNESAYVMLYDDTSYLVSRL